MIFGKIAYLNLLPFHLFIKRSPLCHPFQKTMKLGVPSHINTLYHKRRVHAGFISSITAKKNELCGVGIIAYKKVLSVLILEGESHDDPASQTSNCLAKILQKQGKVLIGDPALRYYYQYPDTLDMATLWYEKTHLPFVFGLLCANTHKTYFRRIARKFSQTSIRIPYYILKQEAMRSHLTPTQIRYYLEHIHYTLTPKAKRGFEVFAHKSHSLSSVIKKS